MKKFITYISRQTKENLRESVYRAVGNDRLQADFPVHFPVVTMMHGYLTPGETAEVLLLYDGDNPAYEDNKATLEADLKRLQEKTQFQYHLTAIEISGEETAVEHLHTFTKLVHEICDDDELYVCCTYGAKPTPIVEMMAVSFAYKIRKNVAVECIVYGRMNHKTGEACVYDITPLFFMT